jgi:type I restriction enzyme, R subunit
MASRWRWPRSVRTQHQVAVILFTRTYDFLASILPYTNAGWEKLSIFLNLLVSKLPAPVEEDLSRGILESIDMDSYRVEKKAALKVALLTRQLR